MSVYALIYDEGYLYLSSKDIRCTEEEHSEFYFRTEKIELQNGFYNYDAFGNERDHEEDDYAFITVDSGIQAVFSKEYGNRAGFRYHLTRDNVNKYNDILAVYLHQCVLAYCEELSFFPFLSLVKQYSPETYKIHDGVFSIKHYDELMGTGEGFFNGIEDVNKLIKSRVVELRGWFSFYTQLGLVDLHYPDRLGPTRYYPKLEDYLEDFFNNTSQVLGGRFEFEGIHQLTSIIRNDDLKVYNNYHENGYIDIKFPSYNNKLLSEIPKYHFDIHYTLANLLKSYYPETKILADYFFQECTTGTVVNLLELTQYLKNKDLLDAFMNSVKLNYDFTNLGIYKFLGRDLSISNLEFFSKKKEEIEKMFKEFLNPLSGEGGLEKYMSNSDIRIFGNMLGLSGDNIGEQIMQKYHDKKRLHLSYVAQDICTNPEDPFSLQEVNEISGDSITYIEENGKTFCFDTNGLYEYVFVNGKHQNPYTRSRLTEKELKQIELDYNILNDKRITPDDFNEKDILSAYLGIPSYYFNNNHIRVLADHYNIIGRDNYSLVKRITSMILDDLNIQSNGFSPTVNEMRNLVLEF